VLEGSSDDPTGVRSLVWLPSNSSLTSLAINFRAPKICIDKSRLCKKMRTVIAVIFHPSRALFDLIHHQSYDRFSVNAAKNPQTQTAFLARNSIKGRCLPLYCAHRDHHACSCPVCKEQHRVAPFRDYFARFRREHKNQDIAKNAMNVYPSM